MGQCLSYQTSTRAFSIPNLVLYAKTDRGWEVCRDSQGVFRWVDSSVYFCVREISAGVRRLNWEELYPSLSEAVNRPNVEEVYPLETEMLDVSRKALIRFFVRRRLNLENHILQVPIVMANFERSDLVDFEGSAAPGNASQEEIEALMADGFGSVPISSGQASLDNVPLRGIPDLPLSNPLRETLGTDFQLELCEVTKQGVATVARVYGVDQSVY